MSEDLRAPAENRISKALEDTGASGDRALRNFRYVVASVNESASAVWADLWKELQGHVATNGMVTPAMEQGFKPACGWAEFIEKLWLLKHYLDYIHRFCKE
jgi:hypothetical protein